MRKGQQQYIDRIKNMVLPEEKSKLFYDDQYKIWEYEYFYEVLDFDIDTILNNRKKAFNVRRYQTRAALYDIICRFGNDISDYEFEVLKLNGDLAWFLYKTKDIEKTISLIKILSREKHQISMTYKMITIGNILISAISKESIRKDIVEYIQYVTEKFVDKPVDDNSHIQYDSLSYSVRNDLNFTDFLTILNIKTLNPGITTRLSFADPILLKRWNDLLLCYISKDKLLVCNDRVCLTPGHTLYNDSKFMFAEHEEVFNYFKNTGIEGKIKIPKIEISIFFSKNFLTFKFTKHNECLFVRETQQSISWHSDDIFTVLLAGDGSIYYNEKSGRTNKNCVYPLSLKKLINRQRHYGFYVKEFTDKLLEYYVKQGSLIAKDLKAYTNKGAFYIPGQINDIMKFHNKRELMDKYCTIQNPNTADINVLYAVSKSLPYVNERSKNLLMNLRSFDEIYDPDNTGNYSFMFQRKYITKSALFLFLSAFIEKRVIQSAIQSANIHCMSEDDKKELTRTIKINIRDYVSDCLTDGIPINLTFKSYNKVLDEHRRITEYVRMERFKKSTNEVNVPKDSIFTKLRTLLPEEFEWIKDKDRLIAEGTIMHHCVCSYANKISSDACAIYSCFYKPEEKRYTIEFRRTRDVYWINQIQSKYDRGCSKEFREYVEQLLKKQ